MIEIGRAVVSLDILEKKFCCDITKCKGACCVEGYSGAPLKEEEAAIIEELYPKFKEYLSEENKAQIAKQGFSVIDHDGDLVTPIIGKNECVFTFTDEQGITLCAIEKAYYEKNTNFRKPVSCHLFPIRIKHYSEFRAVNYVELAICSPARKCGNSDGIYVYEFLKEPLIRALGEDVYNQICIAAKEFRKK